ncbi:putative pumilio homolog 13 [Primulina eburnea]|uniref:putative pumilio homolog 13 n=1 Tax=Primulina eburnea TaxID=1245227 RepID=UPI003C6C7B18
MISFFTYFMVPLVNHQFGSRVIGRCFNIFPAPADETEPIVDVIADNCLEIAKDKNGSCLLQVIVSKVSIPNSHGRQRILSAITLGAVKLSMDQFGNRVLQHVIGLEMPFVVSRIVDELEGWFSFLAKDKYASIVVKQLMEASEGKYSSQIANRIIRSPNFLSVLVDPYGYSVIQSAKTYSNKIVRKTLDRLICRYSDLLDDYKKFNHV